MIAVSPPIVRVLTQGIIKGTLPCHCITCLLVHLCSQDKSLLSSSHTEHLRYFKWTQGYRLPPQYGITLAHSSHVEMWVAMSLVLYIMVSTFFKVNVLKDAHL